MKNSSAIERLMLTRPDLPILPERPFVIKAIIFGMLDGIIFNSVHIPGKLSLSCDPYPKSALSSHTETDNLLFFQGILEHARHHQRFDTSRSTECVFKPSRAVPLGIQVKALFGTPPEKETQFFLKTEDFSE